MVRRRFEEARHDLDPTVSSLKTALFPKGRNKNASYPVSQGCSLGCLSLNTRVVKMSLKFGINCTVKFVLDYMSTLDNLFIFL